MESKENIKLIGIINYKKFRYQSIDEKIKLFLNKNIFELETSPLRQEKPIVSNINLENPLTINRFFPFWFKNKRYRISEILIEELQHHLYKDFIFQKNYYLFQIQEIRIRIRKERLAAEKIKILDEIYRKTISFYNSEDILDYIQNNSLYLKDKTEHLQTNFNNDSLFYDFDYLYYSFIYENADKVFSYIFNYKWENKKIEFIAQIMKLYEAKKVIEFCIKEIKNLKESNTQDIQTKKTNQNVSLSNEKTKIYIPVVFLSQETENIFHKLLLSEDVITNENKPKRRFNTVSYNTFKIINRLHRNIFSTNSLNTFVEFLISKYHFEPNNKTKFANINNNLSKKIEEFIRKELEKLESSQSSQNPNKDEFFAN